MCTAGHTCMADPTKPITFHSLTHTTPIMLSDDAHQTTEDVFFVV
jgi:hypothetical protein